MIVALAILWLVFYGFWLISAIGVKKAVRGQAGWRAARLRLLFIIAAVFLSRLLHIRRIMPAMSHSRAAGVLGLTICASGLAFATWARLHLGRNWGLPMSLKEGHELVMTGPYRYVRHPIYTGILAALLGSALVAGPLWFIVFLIFCPYFIFSATVEEKLMMRQFPNEYPEYRKRTNRLIPFVW